jgi:hypothetical protein
MSNTPPRGGANYTMIDIGELCKRTADHVIEHSERLERIESHIKHIGPLAAKIDLLARPVARPRYVNYAIVIVAIAAIVMATSSVVRTTNIVDQRAQIQR